MRLPFAMKRVYWSAAGLVVVTAMVICLEDRLFVQNFKVVEPNAVYRGAEQRPGPLRRIIRRHGIRTMVCLVEPEPQERRVAESLGVRWIGVPMGDPSTVATFDALEQLAAILGDPANHPVFFHCRRGVYRSNLGQAVYRMKSCGWTLEQALFELRAIGLRPESRGGDRGCVELLRRYYDERIGRNGGAGGG